jgi:2-dehydro-3-deoxyphosphogluconate aldolase / (4S)-4-hydroxy-2-oxoglutarate aldolase
MNQILEKIYRIGIVPVIKIDHAEDAYLLGKALLDGGLPVAEVTFRTSAAKDAIKIINEKLPEMLLGAGTVLTRQQVDDAIEAGAKFIVSPGFNPDIVKYCIEKDIPIIPGCSNASDIEAALSLGITTVKFFPAELLGGLKMIKALAAPYVNVTFIPTGGVNENNICEYLDYEKIIACGGTWMVDAKAIEQKDFERVKKLTQEAVKTMLGIKLEHVGVNGTPDSALEIAKGFSDLLKVGTIEGTSSIFAGTSIEVMRDLGRGTHGHICYTVNNVDRAVNYYESLGFRFIEETKKTDDKGRLKFCYFEGEIGGFAVHLKQKAK